MSIIFKENLIGYCDDLITEFQTEIENLVADIMAGNAHYDTTNDNLTVEKMAELINTVEDLKAKIKAL